jgi:hypothetical protein
MSDRPEPDSFRLLNQLQATLDAVAAQATAREERLATALRPVAGDDEKGSAAGRQEGERLAGKYQTLQALQRRATDLAEAAEADLRQTEAALREWLAAAAALSPTLTEIRQRATGR